MSGLKCPNCGALTALTPIYFSHGGVLSYLNGARQASVPGVIPALMSGRWGGIKYAILCCQACNDLFVVVDSPEDKGWRVAYPIPHKSVADEIPKPIKGEFEEACLCFAVGAHLACLLMCKTVVIALQRQQNVSNLKQLVDKGTISKTLYEQADEVRLWANIVGHENIVPESVTKEDCEQLLVYVESIINATYVEPARFEALKQKREQIKKKTAE